MFSLFKRKSKKEKLEIEYRKLLKESFQLSTSNRKLSDQKKAQSEEILKQIKSLEEKL